MEIFIFTENKTANKKAYFQEYYQKNKDKYKKYAEQNKMKFHCPVCDVSVYYMTTHLKTKKHQSHIQKSEPNDIKNNINLNIE